ESGLGHLDSSLSADRGREVLYIDTGAGRASCHRPGRRTGSSLNAPSVPPCLETFSAPVHASPWRAPGRFLAAHPHRDGARSIITHRDEAALRRRVMDGEPGLSYAPESERRAERPSRLGHRAGYGRPDSM